VKPSPPPQPGPDDRLDAYLDGLLDPDAREAFEREADQSAPLQDAVSLQKRIDDSLRQGFAGHALVPPPLPAPAPLLLPKRWRIGRPLAMAAMLALVFAGVWSLWLSDLVNGAEPLSKVYYSLVDTGFEPGWVCETDDEFALSFAKHIRQPLLLADAGGLEALGLSYNYALGSKTVMLLAKVDQQPVVVFVGQANRVTEPPRAGSWSMSLFERTVGGAVLYELSPFDEPRVIPHFYAVDRPAEPADEPPRDATTDAPQK